MAILALVGRFGLSGGITRKLVWRYSKFWPRVKFAHTSSMGAILAFAPPQNKDLYWTGPIVGAIIDSYAGSILSLISWIVAPIDLQRPPYESMNNDLRTNRGFTCTVTWGGRTTRVVAWPSGFSNPRTRFQRITFGGWRRAPRSRTARRQLSSEQCCGWCWRTNEYYGIICILVS